MPKIKETLEKAYGNIPKDPCPRLFSDSDTIINYRPLKYYWLKLLRKICKRT
jgi:hypothetical protein